MNQNEDFESDRVRIEELKPKPDKLMTKELKRRCIVSK